MGRLINHPKHLSFLAQVELVKILKEFDLYELLHILKQNVKYRQIIGERIVAKMLVDLSDVSGFVDTRRAMSLVGEYVTELRIKVSDIQYKKDPNNTHIHELFQLIDLRCTVGQLKVMHMDLHEEYDSYLFNIIPGVFQEIELLSVMGGPYTIAPSIVLRKLLPHCTGLADLYIYKVFVDFNFLKGLKTLKNIQSLCINSSKISFTSWWRIICNGALEYIRHLQIVDCDFEISWVTDDVRLGWLGDDCTTLLNIQTFTMRNVRFRSLENRSAKIALKFPVFQYTHTLKHVTIQHKNEGTRCHIDIGELIRPLAKANSVESLSILLNPTDHVPVEVQLLTNLHTIRFFDPEKVLVSEYLKFLTLQNMTDAIFETKKCIDKSIFHMVVSVTPQLERLVIRSRETKITSAFIQSLIDARTNFFTNLAHLHIYGYQTKYYNEIHSNLITVHKIETYIRRL